MIKHQTAFFSIIFFVLSVLTVSAQTPKFTWSEVFEESKGVEVGNLLKDDGKHLYFNVMFKEAKGFDTYSVIPGIMKFDYQMKKVAHQDYTASAGEKETILFGGIFYCGGNFLMMTHKHDKAANSTEVMCARIDMETLQPKGEAVSIWKITAPEKRRINWDYTLSNDSSIILLNASYDQKDSEKKNIAIKVINGELKSIQEKLVTLDHLSESYKHVGVTLDNKGNVYNVGKVYSGKAKKESKKDADRNKVASYKITINRYGIDGNESSFDVNMGDKLLDNMRAQVDPKSNDLCVISTYNDIEEEGVIGYSFYRFSGTNGELIGKSDNRFPSDIVQRIQKVERLMINKTSEPSIPKSYGISDFIIQPDGRIFVVFQNNITMVTTSSYASTYTFESYGMIVALLDNKGESKWMHYIPKKQYWALHSTYLYNTKIIFDDKIIILYNELDKNFDYDWLKATSFPNKYGYLGSKNEALMAVEISNEGVATRKQFVNLTETTFPVFIENSVQSSNRNFIIFGYNYNKNINKIGLVQF